MMQGRTGTRWCWSPESEGPFSIPGRRRNLDSRLACGCACSLLIWSSRRSSGPSTTTTLVYLLFLIHTPPPLFLPFWLHFEMISLSFVTIIGDDRFTLIYSSGYTEPLEDDAEILVPDDDYGLYAIDILDPSLVVLV